MSHRRKINALCLTWIMFGLSVLPYQSLIGKVMFTGAIIINIISIISSTVGQRENWITITMTLENHSPNFYRDARQQTGLDTKTMNRLSIGNDPRGALFVFGDVRSMQSQLFSFLFYFHTFWHTVFRCFSFIFFSFHEFPRTTQKGWNELSSQFQQKSAREKAFDEKSFQPSPFAFSPPKNDLCLLFVYYVSARLWIKRKHKRKRSVWLFSVSSSSRSLNAKERGLGVREGSGWWWRHV